MQQKMLRKLLLKLYQPLSIMICAILSNGLYRRNESEIVQFIQPKDQFEVVFYPKLHTKRFTNR